VSGSLEEVRAKLLLIKQIIADCEARGFSPFELEFIYKFLTVKDKHVCPKCEPLHNTLHRGSYVQGAFPNAVSASEVAEALGSIGDNQYDLYPNMHNGGDYSCRCYVKLTNAAEGCAALLSKELIAVT